MLQPINKDNELICPNCACVLGLLNEYPESEKSTINPSLNMFLLGSAIQNNTKYYFRKTPQMVYEERALRKLVDITKEFALPDRLAYETFNQLKRKKRGFRSETEPIKQLILLLSRDENYIHIHKMRAIKSKYEISVNL